MCERQISWAPVQDDYQASLSSTALTSSCRITIKERMIPLRMLGGAGAKGAGKWKEGFFWWGGGRTTNCLSFSRVPAIMGINYTVSFLLKNG